MNEEAKEDQNLLVSNDKDVTKKEGHSWLSMSRWIES